MTTVYVARDMLEILKLNEYSKDIGSEHKDTSRHADYQHNPHD